MRWRRAGANSRGILAGRACLRTRRSSCSWVLATVSVGGACLRVKLVLHTHTSAKMLARAVGLVGTPSAVYVFGRGRGLDGCRARDRRDRCS